MGRPALTIPLLILLGGLAAAGLAWGAAKALSDSADLERRAEEVELVLRRHDPYADPDMTYPPSAEPVFVALIAPIRGRWLRLGWLVLNGLALIGLIGAIWDSWGKAWPPWAKAAFALAAAATKPVRAGFGLGQFHLIPSACLAASIGLMERKRPIAAGLLVGIALTKPTMAAPFLFVLMAKRRWTTLGVALGLNLALTLAMSAWLGIGPAELLREWLDRAREQLSAGTIDVPSLASRAWPAMATRGSTLSLVVLAIAGAAIWALRKQSEAGLTSLSLAFAAIFTYHRPYDLVLLLPALASLFDGALARKSPAAGLGVLAFAGLLIAPNHPSVAGGLERVYDVALIGGAYLAMAALIVQVACERRADGPAETNRSIAETR